MISPESSSGCSKSLQLYAVCSDTLCSSDLSWLDKLSERSLWEDVYTPVDRTEPTVLVLVYLFLGPTAQIT